MSWNIGDNRNLFLKLKSELGPYHVVLTTSKTSSKKLTLTVVEMQQLPDIEKTGTKQEKSCLKWTIYNSRRKVCVNRKVNTDNLKTVAYRYRNNLYLKDNEVDLKLTEYQSLLAKRVYLLSYIDLFYKRCIVLDETSVHNLNNFDAGGISPTLVLNQNPSITDIVEAMNTLIQERPNHSESCNTVKASRKTQKVKIYFANEGSGLAFFITSLGYVFGGNVGNEFGVM